MDDQHHFEGTTNTDGVTFDGGWVSATPSSFIFRVSTAASEHLCCRALLRVLYNIDSALIRLPSTIIIVCVHALWTPDACIHGSVQCAGILYHRLLRGSRNLV